MESANMERRDFLATYQQYKDFIASTLWLDLQLEIKTWIEDINGYLEHENDIQEIYRFQGRLQSCKQLLSLPERILATLEMAYESAERPQEQVILDLDSNVNGSDYYYQEQLTKWAEEDVEND